MRSSTVSPSRVGLKLALGEQHPVALEDPALVGEVDRGDLDALAADVVPDVELGPVRDREDPHVLALVEPAVVEAPQLGALHLRVPLAELVAVGVDALLGAGLLLVAAAATEGGGEAALLERVEQGADLEPVAAGLAVVDDDAVGDRLLDAGHDQADAEPAHPVVAAGEHLGEVVAGVHLEHRERDLGREERLLGQPHHDDGVLAAREHQDGLLELGGDLAEDVDRLRLELVELAQPVVGMRDGHVVRETSSRRGGARVGRARARKGSPQGIGRPGPGRNRDQSLVRNTSFARRRPPNTVTCSRRASGLLASSLDSRP